jgi:hypothetical protein
MQVARLAAKYPVWHEETVCEEKVVCVTNLLRLTVGVFACEARGRREGGCLSRCRKQRVPPRYFHRAVCVVFCFVSLLLTFFKPVQVHVEV